MSIVRILSGEDAIVSDDMAINYSFLGVLGLFTAFVEISVTVCGVFYVLVCSEK